MLGEPEECFYPGISVNYLYLTGGDFWEDRVLLGILDVPFSLILDTILLPSDTYHYFRYRSDQKKQPSNQANEPTSLPASDPVDTQSEAALF